jgi:penicillin-binding protein 1A
MARPPAKSTTSSRKSGKAGARASGKGKKRPRPSTWKGRLLRWGLWSAGLALALFAGVLFYFEREAAAIDISNLNEVPERTQVYDLRGRLVGVLHGENRIFIPISEVPPAFKEALLAREDNRFYEHQGVDWFGVLRAAFRNVREGDIVQGASTLTMQLARNRFALSGKNFQRKIVEAFLSRRIEARYSKDQILEAYLNIVYFGSGQYGLEQASRTYFEKPARALSLGESAMLVGIIRSPNRYSPFRNPEGAVAEMDMVLDRMVETDRLAPAAAVAAKQMPPAIRPPARRNPADSWSMDVIRKELELILDAHNIAEGGLRVFTTLDLDLQKAAEDGLEEHLGAQERASGYSAPTRAAHTAALAGLAAGQEPPEPGYLQGAVVVLDNGTGGIRAMVGGRDVKQSRFNRATQAKRQVGSLFKPFVYTAAFEAGLSPGAALDDGPIRPGEIAGASRSWRPQNSDGTFGGMTPISVGLARSRNTMAVRAGNIAGLPRVREMADRCGLATGIPNYPSVYLGSFECTLRDLTSAYTAFPNRGVRPRPYVVTEIQDRYGRRVYLATFTATPSFSPRAATTTSRMLEAVMRPGGTAAAALARGVDFPAAGKTGTTDNYRDAWFVGYTGLLTAGVWVGFDERNRGLAQGYGSRLSLPVWVKVMRTAKEAGYQLGSLP